MVPLSAAVTLVMADGFQHRYVLSLRGKTRIPIPPYYYSSMDVVWTLAYAARSQC